MRVLSFTASSGPVLDQTTGHWCSGLTCHSYKVKIPWFKSKMSHTILILASGSAWSGRRTVTAFNQVGSNPIGAAKLLEIEILVQNYSPGL